MAVYLLGVCKTQLGSVPKCCDEKSRGCDNISTLVLLEMCRNFSYKHYIFKTEVVLHTKPGTMGTTEILTGNKISRLIIDNPFTANVPFMEKPVSCFALVSCIKNNCVKVLQIYLKQHSYFSLVKINNLVSTQMEHWLNTS